MKDVVTEMRGVLNGFGTKPRGRRRAELHKRADAVLVEFERRERIESRRDAWLYAELSGPNRAVQHMLASDRDHGVSLQVAGKDIAWAWRGDYWSALEAALNQANVP